MKKFWVFSLIWLALWLSDAKAGSVWSRECTEATALLHDLQQEVVKKRRVLQQKRAQRFVSPKSRRCSSTQRGFNDEPAWCVRHRSSDALTLREIQKAERELEKTIEEFSDRLHAVHTQCLPNHGQP